MGKFFSLGSIVFVLIAADIFIKITLARSTSVQYALIISLSTALLGLFVIVYAFQKLLPIMALRLRDVDEIDDNIGSISRDAENECFWSNAILLVAGALVMLPGPITDLMGLTFMVPALRLRVAHGIMSYYSFS